MTKDQKLLVFLTGTSLLMIGIIFGVEGTDIWKDAVIFYGAPLALCAIYNIARH